MSPSELSRFLVDCREHIADVRPWVNAGRLTRINGLVMEASGLKLALGSGCLIQIPGNGTVEAEVVGFAGDRLFMMPAEDVYGLSPGALVIPMESPPPHPVPMITPNTTRAPAAAPSTASDNAVSKAWITPASSGCWFMAFPSWLVNWVRLQEKLMD